MKKLLAAVVLMMLLAQGVRMIHLVPTSVFAQECTPGDHPAVEHCSMNGIHVIRIHIHDPSITIRPVIAPHGGRTFLHLLAGPEGIAAINGDYSLGSCDNGRNCGEGLTYVAGENYTQGPPDTYNYRRSMAFNQFLEPHIGYPSEQAGYLWHVIGGGPRFTEGGVFRWECLDGSRNHDCPAHQNGTVVINDEYFGQSAENWWYRRQSAIGFNEDGSIIFFAASEKPVTMQELHDVLWQLGSRNNLRLDGGHGSSLYYNDGPGHYVYTTPVPVPNAWVIFPSHTPPTSTPSPPTNTPIPPTSTPVPPSPTPVPPTNTPLPPTSTPAPTNTPIPPTYTPALPTSTPIPPTSPPPVLPTNTPVPPPVSPPPPPLPTTSPYPGIADCTNIYGYHIVHKGETLYSIGRAYLSHPMSIASCNHIINPDIIPTGMRLAIPISPWHLIPPGPVAQRQIPTSPLPTCRYRHTVRHGETLTRLSLHYGVNVWSIVTANNIANPNIIYAGQELCIP